MRLKAFASLANRNPQMHSALCNYVSYLKLDPHLANSSFMNELITNFFDVKNATSSVLASNILEAFRNYSYVLSSEISEHEILEIRRRRAAIEQPPAEADQIVKFNANLIGAINFEAELVNFDTIDEIRVLVRILILKNLFQF